MSDSVKKGHNCQNIGSAYGKISFFAKKCGSMTYTEFENYILESIELFTVPDDFDVNSLNSKLDSIISAIPSIKRLFSNPITRLIDVDEIYPVEAVRVINNRSIVHASCNSILWNDIDKWGIKPKKLMTVGYEDDYCIYENVVFCKTVDHIFGIIRKNSNIIKELLFGRNDVKLDFLGRVNHSMYLRAMSKLQVGYVRDHDAHRPLLVACLDKMEHIKKELSFGLKSVVYKKCKDIDLNINLRKTAVFKNQKDYSKIFSLMVKLNNGYVVNCSSVTGSNEKMEDYAVFISALMIFAARHFGFVFDEKHSFELDSPECYAEYKNWKLKISGGFVNGIKYLSLVLTKNKSYRMLFVPSFLELKECLSKKLQSVNADEYLIVSNLKGIGEDICVDIHDVESFRRIQRYILKGMIYCDETFDTCPFCGADLNKDGDGYECKNCRTLIREEVCPNGKGKYYRTDIKDLKKKQVVCSKNNSATEIHYLTEDLMFFRNITSIDNTSSPICPYCNVTHHKCGVKQ